MGILEILSDGVIDPGGRTLFHLRSNRLRTLRAVAALVLAALIFPASVMAQAANARDDQNQPADEPVLHFTPEMARGMARIYTKNVLSKRYELDPAKADQASEAVARRLMVAAQQNDVNGADFIEYMIGQVSRGEAEGRGPGITPEMGQGVAKRIGPMLPALKDLVRDVSADVRPMLSFKNQLRLTGDVALAGTAINAFEQNLQRWSKGGAEPFEDPFRSHDAAAVQKDPDGLSKDVKRAQETAKKEFANVPWSSWKSYLDDAVKLYEFDPSQTAAGESLLREYTERAQTVARDANWQNRLSRIRFWYWLLMNMRQGWGNLIWQRLQDNAETTNDSITQIGNEFKSRIEQLPTAAQRSAADAHIRALLSEQGYATTEPAL